MTAGLWELQKSIFALLSSSAALQALLGTPARVYDVPPTAPIYPFVLMGNATAEEWGASDMTGMKVALSIEAYANGNRGRADVRRIIDAVVATLNNNTSIAPAAGAVVLCQYLSSDDERLDPDGLTWMGAAKFNILYQTS